MKKFYALFILLLLLSSCSERNPQNPFDPEVYISVSNLQYEKLTINKIKLSWENDIKTNTGIIRIDKNVGSASWQDCIAELASNVTTWTDNNAEINQIIKYRIKMIFSGNQSEYAETEIIDNIIPVPENLNYTITYIDEINLTWEYSMPGIDGFKIARQVGSGTWDDDHATVPANVFEYTDSGLTLGENYNYKIKANFGTHYSQSTSIISYTAAPAGMIFTQGGTFDMGDHYNEGDSDELPVHSVTLDDFYIGKFEVTQAEYEAVVGSNPSYLSGDDLPVEQVSWYDAVMFCNLKSQQEGLTECYNLSYWSCDFDADGYRLPTEAEWEYAARGGINWTDNFRYSGCHEIGDLPDYAWYDSNSSNQTHPVGTKLPNQLGIHDMSGNVSEWCYDWYDSTYYTSGSSINPQGPDSGDWRVLRGGNRGDNDNRCRVANRFADYPINSQRYYGFRIVRRVEL
ncbi:MAG: SUMF1/EgtB/PvdO family nonheme iron enzyme [Candidatus Cloacimonetes bacterium]|nr:SUMF1/EgtB/PvdO family nonheme iron enzyme [Candidatus Cloacimonadota bacterium]